MAPTLPVAGPAGGLGDMFLSVKGARAGLIKGESQDDTHKGEIEVVSWSWGMQARSSLGGEGVAATGRPSIHELKVIKRVDSASTALMSALRTNEPISKAVLTVRKAGTFPLEYLKVTIEGGRVTGLSIEADDETPELVEHLSFSFNKITVEYVPQGKDGQGLGGMVFTDQFGEGT